jgi:exodeoxyribonuclease I
MPLTLYWHDYETFGADPRRDRPAQFGGMRTDTELNVSGEPLVLYCKPADDMLPQPEACLVTGITPQKAAQEGVCEAQFIARVHHELARPGTCGVGYNSIRFDDEVTRHALYRNFFDPYAREWRNGNSRWDIIDVVRLARALRPAGMEWPDREDGTPSFRLDRITEANGIRHESAHDALADVAATMAVARLIRQRQPKLYDFVFQHRGKHEVTQLLRLGSMRPVLHVSGKYPASRYCIAMVVALAEHPVNRNEVIVYDLSVDPGPLFDLTSEDIRERLFTPADRLPENVERVALKTIHINHCPVVVPVGVMRPADAERLSIDVGRCRENLKKLKESRGLAAKLQAVFEQRDRPIEDDPDLMLYSGGFFSDRDRALMERVRSLSPDELRTIEPRFQDARLPEMLFRYRARNWPETLNDEERARWNRFRRKRLTIEGRGGSLLLEEYRNRLKALKNDSACTPAQRCIIDELEVYAKTLNVD